MFLNLHTHRIRASMSRNEAAESIVASGHVQMHCARRLVLRQLKTPVIDENVEAFNFAALLRAISELHRDAHESS
jgi:hypothetical protein